MFFGKILAQFFSENNTSMKLVLIARADLGMKKGKLASQCAHAAIACYKQAVVIAPDTLKLWENAGQPKIVLRSDKNGEECLLQLVEKATRLKLVCALIRDAGFTQVDRGSITVLGIGPGKSQVIDQITNHLKLM